MKRAILLAHYDRDGIIDPYVIAAAKSYRQFADTLLLISSSAQKIPVALRDCVDRFISKDNVGYDFGSWKAGLQSLGDPTTFDEIVFVNDSVYGPLFDLGTALAHPRVTQSDYWGMVLSEDKTAHIQSWFFGLRASVIRSQAFEDFWRSAGEDLPKEELIRRRELGLSVVMRREGFQLGGVYDGRLAPLATVPEILRNLSPMAPGRAWRHIRKTSPYRAPFNPSELFYDRLWEAGVPFIKRRLLHTNYYGLDLQRVMSDLERIAPEWHALIAAHGRRTGEHAWPRTRQ